MIVLLVRAVYACQRGSVMPDPRLGRFLTSRRHTLAVIGTIAPWVVAVVGGVLLSIASRHWSESTVFIVGCVFAVVLAFVGVPVLVFSWAYLNRKEKD